MPSKKTILAIDDDASVCDFYEGGLDLLGYEVNCVMNAAKARQFLASKKPDLIIMDIMMPDQDGISLTRELRADPATGHIPIIVVSGLADAGTLNDAMLFGAVDYMVKPVDLDTLKAKIERVFAAVQKRKKPQE